MVRGKRDDLPQSLDVFGVNFYSRLHLRFPGTQRVIGDFAYRDRSGNGFSDNGWEIVPQALGPLLDIAAESGLPPLVVTENGIADATDRYRSHFINTHVSHILFAISRGVPIYGYFHWSLIDNYEWLEGFEPRFGLYEVDRITLDRRARPSVTRSATSGAIVPQRLKPSDLSQQAPKRSPRIARPAATPLQTAHGELHCVGDTPNRKRGDADAARRSAHSHDVVGRQASRCARSSTSSAAPGTMSLRSPTTS